MPVTFATGETAPDLEAIWRDAFPEDTSETIALFFSYALRRSRCLTWEEDGRPVSMAFLLPAALERRDGWGGALPALKLYYIYAAATLTPYRGRGIFGSLLRQAHEWARADGADACFLRPAESSLFSYYERFGYTPFFQTLIERIPREKFLRESGLPLRYGAVAPAPPSDGAAKRNALLGNYPAWVRWPDWLVEYAAAAVKREGGELLTDGGGLALCGETGDTLFIREWLCRPEAEAALRRAVAARFSAGIIVRRSPAGWNTGGQPETFGMICPLTTEARLRLSGLDKSYPYMGLAFD